MQNFQALGTPPPHPLISPPIANSWLRACIPANIYLIHLTIILLKSSALPEPSTQEPVVSSTNQNINGPSRITSTKHHKTIDFLCLCALAINFLLSRLNLALYLNSYVQGVSEAIKRVFAQVGFGVGLKPLCMLSSVFR